MVLYARPTWRLATRRRRLSAADFCSRAPEFPRRRIPALGPGGALSPLSQRPRVRHRSAPRGALGSPCGRCTPCQQPPLLRVPADPWRDPGPHAAKPLPRADLWAKALGHRVFPISVPRLFPTANPSTFILSLKLKKSTATKTWTWDLLKFTTGASHRRALGCWLLVPAFTNVHLCRREAVGTRKSKPQISLLLPKTS